MKIPAFPTHLRATALSALLLLSAAAVQAAVGFTVTPAQQAQIKTGMSRDEVRVVLGRPAHNVKYVSEPGRTWTYGIQGSGDRVFDVDFSADGKVLSTDQRTENMD